MPLQESIPDWLKEKADFGEPQTSVVTDSELPEWLTDRASFQDSEIPDAEPLEIPSAKEESPFQFIQPTKAKEDVSLIPLAKRVRSRFLSSLVETGLPTKEERPTLGRLRGRLRGFNEPFGSKPFDFVPQTITTEQAEEIKAFSQLKPQTLFEDVAELERRIQEKFAQPLPEGAGEKAADAIGGLAAFITRLALLHRVLPLTSIPKFFRSVFVWTVEDQIAGGSGFEGASMALGLGGIAALPIRTGLKISAETIAFGSLAAVHGADEVDIYISMLIPSALRGLHGTKLQLTESLRSARTSKQLEAAVIKAGEIAAAVNPEGRKPTPDELNQSIREYTANLTPEQIKKRAKDIKGFREMVFPSEKAKEVSKIEPSKGPTEAEKVEADTIRARLNQISKEGEVVVKGLDSKDDKVFESARQLLVQHRAEREPLEARLRQITPTTVFRREGPKATIISKYRGRYFAESEQGIEDSVIFAKGGAALLELPLQTKTVGPGKMFEVGGVDDFVREFASPKEITILERTDRSLTGGTKKITKRIFRDLDLPEELRHIIGRPLVIAMEVVAARGAARRGVKWVRMGNRDEGRVEIVEIPDPSVFGIKKPTEVSKVEPSREAAIAKMVDADIAEKEAMKTLFEMRGKKFTKAQRTAQSQKIERLMEARAKIEQEFFETFGEEPSDIVFGEREIRFLTDIKVQAGITTKQPDLAKAAKSGRKIPKTAPFVGTHESSNVKSFKEGKLEQRDLAFSVARNSTESLSSPTVREPKGVRGIVIVAIWGKGLDYENPVHRKRIDKILESAPDTREGRGGLGVDTWTIKQLREQGISWVNGWNGIGPSSELHVINSKNIKVVGVEGPAIAGRIGPVESEELVKFGREIQARNRAELEAESRPSGVLAVKDKKGKIFVSATAAHHGEVVTEHGLNRADIVDSGFIIKGKFVKGLSEIGPELTEKFDKKSTTPTVIARIGPQADPVVINDKLKPVYYNRARPWVYDNFGEFLVHYETGQAQIPKKVLRAVKDLNDPKQLFDFMVKDKRIKLGREKAKPGQKKRVKPRDIPVSITEKADFPVERTSTEAELEASQVLSRQLELQSDAIQRLPGHQRAVVEGLAGLNNRPRKSYKDLAELLDVTEEQVAWLENQAILNIRKALGTEAPDATQESSTLKDDPHPHRRGLVTLPTASKILEIAGIIPRLISDFVNIEARSMTQVVRRHGGLVGEETADFMNIVIDQQLGYLGNLQPSQIKAQARLNRPDLIRAGFNMQHRAFATLVKSKDGTEVLKDSIVSDIEGNALLVAGENWVVDPIVDIVQGRLAPRTPAELAVAETAGRTPAMETARLLESVGLEITVGGNQFLFKGTPEGKIFLAMSTQMMHDILIRGHGRADGLWEALEDGYMALNAISRVKTRRRMEKIQTIIVQSYPQTGYKHIGPELARAFPRRPSAVMAKNGVRVQVEVTDPRKYMDSVYTTSAIRAGFVQYFGQDGKRVQELKEKYVGANGKPVVFDNAIRTMSDVPPLIFGRASISALRSPSSPEYNFFRGASSALELAKQGLLSQTAIVQLSEPFAFGPQFGFKPMMKGLAESIPFLPSRKAAFDILVENRIITEDIINLTIDRAHSKSDFINKVAGVMSRLHGNKFANELANERPAGRMGLAKMAEMTDRMQKGLPPRESDVLYLHGLLEYPIEVARRLAAGEGTSLEYLVAARRAARQAVGSTAIRSQRSLLQNTRVYGFLVPFTRFFSNRIRTFDLLYQSMAESGRNYRENRTPQTLRSLEISAYNLSKFLVFSAFAGIVAGYLASMLREGPVEGSKQRNRELVNNPVNFISDMFAWGTFGPVYGAFYQGLFEGTKTEESSESVFKKIGRMAFPASELIDTYDAVRGRGQFRNMSGSERLSQYIKMHLPVMKTLPGIEISNLLGMQIRDPKTEAAVKRYWSWRFDPSNGAVPRHGGTPASRTNEERMIGIHLRRAFEAQDAGRDPLIHLSRAFAAAGGAIDIKAAILSRTLLDRPELTDAHRREMAKILGPDKMRLLEERDLMLRFLAEEIGPMFEFGPEIKAEKRRAENLELEATTIRP